MEIIDKSHKEIKVGRRLEYAIYFRVVNDLEIYISTGACEAYGLSYGLYAHFVNDEDRWYVYFDSDPDGFQLLERTGKSACRIRSKSLVALFIKRTHHDIPCKFQMKLTEAKQNGNHLIEILHHTPLED